MLTKEDMLTIRSIVKEEVESEVARRINLLEENVLAPNFTAITEGINALKNQLNSLESVSELKETVEVHGRVIKEHSKEIKELKKKVG